MEDPDPQKGDEEFAQFIKKSHEHFGGMHRVWRRWDRNGISKFHFKAEFRGGTFNHGYIKNSELTILDENRVQISVPLRLRVQEARMWISFDLEVMFDLIINE